MIKQAAAINHRETLQASRGVGGIGPAQFSSARQRAVSKFNRSRPLKKRGGFGDWGGWDSSSCPIHESPDDDPSVSACRSVCELLPPTEPSTTSHHFHVTRSVLIIHQPLFLHFGGLFSRHPCLSFLPLFLVSGLCLFFSDTASSRI